MSNFNNNWRRKQELRGRPIADNIYISVFGPSVGINRYEKEDNNILDRKFAIDVTLTTNSGLVLVGQEKFLSHKYINFGTVTIEHMQNPLTGERGDWFKMGVQFYLTAYYNNKHTGFEKWALLDWPAIVVATDAGLLNWRDNENKQDGARASFRYVKMDEIPSGCIIASNGI